MTRILALDTATKTASAALLLDERVLAEGYADLGRHHAAVLLPFVQSVLDLAGVTKVDSAALSLLLSWRRQAQARAQALSFRNLPDSVHSLARLYGLADLIH